MLQNKKIILASNSPRRQEFLKLLHIPFEIKTSNVDEVYSKELKAKEITEFLATLKANSFKETLNENEILITSDTIVWLDNQAIEKPRDYEHATEILQKLSGKTHEVITSFVLKSNKKTEIYTDITFVTFRELTLSEIEFYIKQYQPYDKAGSYGIQDWIGLIGITKIEGSYTNVVGLPTHLIYEKLNNF